MSDPLGQWTGAASRSAVRPGDTPGAAPVDRHDAVGPPVHVPVPGGGPSPRAYAAPLQPGAEQANGEPSYVEAPYAGYAGPSYAEPYAEPLHAEPYAPAAFFRPDSQPAAHESEFAAYADAYGDEQVGSGGIYRPGSRRRAHRYKRRRPLLRAAIALVVAVLAVPVGTLGWADGKLNRDVDLDTVAHRPPPGKGTNYLIVGSDSRQGLSDHDKKHLHTGSAGGRRTDSMILLHTGRHGTSMMSLPRDSWVTVPGFRSPKTGKRHVPAGNKLNASFSMGGPKMLVRTIERNTGIHVDHYTEVGFAGFVNVVNAVGGVRMCVERDIDDKKSGLHLTKGCHMLHGRSALAFVRQRHQESEGDLGRSRNQQKFLSALAHRASQPDRILDPGTLYSTLDAGLSTLIVDEGTGLRDLAEMFRSLQSAAHGKRKQIKVPTSGIGVPTSKGSAIVWDRKKARKIFDAIQHDRVVRAPKGSAK